MIVPDKKTEAYLNEPVSPKGVLRLCRAGVLPSSDFLRAAALCRSDRKWGKFILLILRFLTGLSFLTAAFFVMVAKWSFFYQTGGFILLAVLFVLCACARSRSAVADYAGAAFNADLGLRIDYLLLSPSAADALQTCVVDKTPRAAEKPSDHTALVATFKE